MFDLYKMNNSTNQINNNDNIADNTVDNTSEKNINNITLTYFLNKNQYPEILEQNKKSIDDELNHDKQFYRRRIIELTKNAFKREIEDIPLRNHFNCYIKSCIAYLKFNDKQEIIQEEYKNLSMNSGNNSVCDKASTNIVDDDEYIDCDYLMKRPDVVKKVTLDGFVVTNKKEEIKPFPKKQNINLHDSKFKRKGVHSTKQNISENGKKNKEQKDKKDKKDKKERDEKNMENKM